MVVANLICRGFAVDQYCVPSFEVHAGEQLALQLPAYFHGKNELIAALTGSTPSSDIEIAKSSVFALPANPPTGWRRWFSNPTPTEWLIAHGFPRHEVVAVLAQHAIDNRFRLEQLAANSRALLGLAAAFRRQPNVVVFDTAGLDPAGERAVQEMVQSHLGQSSVVYLCWPTRSHGGESYRVYPGSTAVELTIPKAMIA
jgi:hypothetical protein